MLRILWTSLVFVHVAIVIERDRRIQRHKNNYDWRLLYLLIVRFYVSCTLYHYDVGSSTITVPNVSIKHFYCNGRILKPNAKDGYMINFRTIDMVNINKTLEGQWKKGVKSIFVAYGARCFTVDDMHLLSFRLSIIVK